MDPATVVDDLPPDEPPYDMLHDPDVVAGLTALVAREQPHFDVELLASDQSDSLWVRVTPTLLRKNDDYPDNWVIDDGMCQRLDDDGQPVGKVGSCNGYFSMTDAHGHTVGKLTINIP